jgi:hypothetical protein
METHEGYSLVTCKVISEKLTYCQTVDAVIEPGPLNIFADGKITDVGSKPIISGMVR